MSMFFPSKAFVEFRKARSNMLLSRKNQLLLEFSFWNEPVPRSGPNIYELRSYQLRVSTEIPTSCPPMLLWGSTGSPMPTTQVDFTFCDVFGLIFWLAYFLSCPVLLFFLFFIFFSLIPSLLLSSFIFYNLTHNVCHLTFFYIALLFLRGKT